MFAYVRELVVWCLDNELISIIQREMIKMKINDKLDLMYQLNQIEKDIKNVKSIVASSTKGASDCYDFSMTTEEVNNISIIVGRLVDEISELKR